ncbi:MAG: hypothetical protein QGH83_02395 [Candidatus Pacebacteria bacterium]|nr:hypothetical protein [Candidatus Paceibacterota bacterium]
MATKKKEKLRVVKPGDEALGGIPTPVIKLDDDELANMSTGKYKVFTNGAEDRDLKGKYLAINVDHLVSVFPIEDKTVLFSTGGNSWTVAEDFATVLKRLNANI